MCGNFYNTSHIHYTQVTLVFCFSRVLLQLPPCKLSSVRADSESSELDRVVGHLAFTTLNPSCPRWGHFKSFWNTGPLRPKIRPFQHFLEHPIYVFSDIKYWSHRSAQTSKRIALACHMGRAYWGWVRTLRQKTFSREIWSAGSIEQSCTLLHRTQSSSFATTIL